MFDNLLVKTQRNTDHRGFFSEIYSKKKYKDFGINIDFVQENHSISNEVGTLRGLHFQSPPYAQAKLVRCGQGAIYDVIVDIRRGSPFYGMWQGFNLDDKNGDQLYVPVGFAHGFITLISNSEIIYKCSDYYAPETEGSLIWNDKFLGIKWPTDFEPILSDKDRQATSWKNLETPFIYGVNS